MARKNYQIIAPDGRIVDDAEGLGPDGLLRHGYRQRTPLMFRDADSLSDVQRAVMADKAARVGFSDALCRHQPGPAIVTDRSGIERKAQAYAEYVSDLQTAWRNPSPLPVADVGGMRGQKPGDQCTINGAPGHLNEQLECVPDQQDARPVYDAAEGRRIKAAAYQQMVDELTSAWKGPGR